MYTYTDMGVLVKVKTGAGVKTGPSVEFVVSTVCFIHFERHYQPKRNLLYSVLKHCCSSEIQ